MLLWCSGDESDCLDDVGGGQVCGDGFGCVAEHMLGSVVSDGQVRHDLGVRAFVGCASGNRRHSAAVN
jgi:hypothetical protein